MAKSYRSVKDSAKTGSVSRRQAAKTATRVSKEAKARKQTRTHTAKP